MIPDFYIHQEILYFFNIKKKIPKALEHAWKRYVERLLYKETLSLKYVKPDSDGSHDTVVILVLLAVYGIAGHALDEKNEKGMFNL